MPLRKKNPACNLSPNRYKTYFSSNLNRKKVCKHYLDILSSRVCGKNNDKYVSSFGLIAQNFTAYWELLSTEDS